MAVFLLRNQSYAFLDAEKPHIILGKEASEVKPYKDILQHLVSQAI